MCWQRFEGELPECADGEDNDEDGVADRDDRGCTSVLDDTELDFESDELCQNGLDDDGDSLIDDQDPGCWCADT